MGEIAVFVPNEEMYRQARALADGGGYHVRVLKKVQTENVVNEARDAISQEGVQIIVARGKQAALIKRYTKVTLAEIKITAQELGLLILRAKKIINKPIPHIAVFGWGEMLCDTTYFDTLYGIQLKRYIFEDDEKCFDIMENACGEKPDLVIGGLQVQEFAAYRGIPFLSFISTDESIKTALDNAESLYHMSEMEQFNYAQVSTILDSSNNGIIKLTPAGTVLLMNPAMEHMLGQSQKQLAGLHITELFKDLDKGALERVLSGEMENYTTFASAKSHTAVLVMNPIQVGDRVEGAIVSCSRLKPIDMSEKKRLQEQYLRGYVARMDFDDMQSMLPGMSETIRRAKLYAQSSSPVLIEGYNGQEQDLVCQGIHNYSSRRNGPFIVVNLAGTTEDQQMRILFGTMYEHSGGRRFREESRRYGEKPQYEPGAIEKADKGTLVIQSIDKMTLPVQYHFSKAIRSRKILYNTIEDMVIVDTRIIVCTSKDIDTCRRLNRMRSDLYYVLNALKLHLPRLAERPGDVEILLDGYMKQYMEQYGRYHTLTSGARKLLLNYGWPGNSIQMQAFCERMILTVGRRTITEEYVRGLMEELYANTEEPDYYVQHGLEAPKDEERAAGGQEEKQEPGAGAEQGILKETLEEALKRYKGNRTLTARALGISTTTLWRKIKYYGIKI